MLEACERTEKGSDQALILELFNINTEQFIQLKVLQGFKPQNKKEVQKKTTNTQ